MPAAHLYISNSFQGSQWHFSFLKWSCLWYHGILSMYFLYQQAPGCSDISKVCRRNESQKSRRWRQTYRWWSCPRSGKPNCGGFCGRFFGDWWRTFDSTGCKCSRFVAIHLEYICMSIFTRTYVCNTLPETNMFAPENGWFGILVSFWEGPSWGAMLGFGRV